jgi:type IV pilus assembly protein PilM
MANYVIGLDIGTHAVRAVELSLGRGRPVVRRMGQVTLPVGAVVAGEVVDATQVSAALKRLWSEVGFSGRKVVVGVANSRVVARMADLPAMPEAELRSSLRYQVQDLIPIPVDDAELDFQIVDHLPGGEGAEDKVRILLVAAHRDMLRSFLAALEGADLEAKRIDLVPFALIRALHDPTSWLEDDEPAQGQEVIIGAGAGVTNVVVHENGVPRFVRTLPTGGGSVTEALASSLGLDDDAAEAVKRGVPGADVMADQPHVDDIAAASLMPLVNEIAGSLDFHLAQVGEDSLRRVVLAGGGGRLRALRGVLEDQLGVSVVDGTPYARLDLSKVPLDPELVARSGDIFTVAIGLALAGEGDSDTQRISLLPGDISAMREERRRVMLAGAGVGGFAVLLVGLSFFRGTQVDAARSDAQRAEAQASALESQVTALHDIEMLQSDIDARRTTATATLLGDVAWTSLFRDIEAVIPSDVWLETFDAKRAPTGGGEVTISARGFDHTSAARWLLRSEELSSLDNVWLSSSRKSDAGGRSIVSFGSSATLGSGALSDRASRYEGDVK